MNYLSTSELRPFVDRLLARSALTEEEQDTILALPFRRVLVKKRRDFVPFGDEPSYSSFIASGMAARFVQTLDGKRQFTAFHMPGDMADLHSAVRPVDVGGLNALCDTVTLRIPHASIRKLAARYPAIAEAFWRDCLLDAAVLVQWVVNVGRRDAATRMAHILCEMAVRTGRDRQPLLSFMMPVTQEQIGDATGLTSVHVNRTLKNMKDLVTFKDNAVIIHDWAKLTRAGDFDVNYLTADTGKDRQARLLCY